MRNKVVDIRLLFGFLLLYGLVAVCYLPVFSNGFLDSWDDQWMVMNVFTECGFRLENLIAVFTQSYKGQYSPLVELNYTFPLLPESSEIPTRFYVYPVLVAGISGVLYSYRKNRLLVFGSLFFVIHLLLSLHIVAMPRLGIVADRYLYLSLPGILLLVSYPVVGWIEKEHRVKLLLFLSIFFYSLYFMGYTHRYSKQWKDTDTVKHYLRSFYKGEYEEKDINGRENRD